MKNIRFLSFSLSIVLLNSVYTYVTSFDFDKFVADFSLTDFTVSDTTVINNYAPYNTANVSQDFISQAESLNGLEDIGNIYLWTSKQPLSENSLLLPAILQMNWKIIGFDRNMV